MATHHTFTLRWVYFRLVLMIFMGCRLTFQIHPTTPGLSVNNVDQDGVTIQFTGTEDVTGYLCRLDNADRFIPCRSPLHYQSLSNGRHRLIAASGVQWTKTVHSNDNFFASSLYLI